MKQKSQTKNGGRNCMSWWDYYQTSRLVDLPDKDRTVLLFQICKAFPKLYHYQETLVITESSRKVISFANFIIKYWTFINLTEKSQRVIPADCITSWGEHECLKQMAWQIILIKQKCELLSDSKDKVTHQHKTLLVFTK